MVHNKDTNGAQPRQCELHLDAAFRPHQLVPLVDDDEPEIAKDVGDVVAREQQRETLRRRDERLGQSSLLPGALCRRRIPGSRLDLPRHA